MPTAEKSVRVFLLFLSFTILFVLLYLSDVWKVIAVISNANLYYIFFAFMLSLFLMPVRTFRWRMLLEKIKIHVKFTKLFPVYMSGMLVSNLTPGKIGEPFKNYALKKTSGVSISKTLPSVFIERVFDVFSTIILSFIGIFMLTLPGRVGIILFAVVMLYLLSIIIISYISAKKSRIYNFSKKIFRLFWWLPLIKKFEIFLEDFAEKFNRSIIKYKDVKILLKSFILSMGIWIVEGFIVYLCFLSIGINVNILAAVSFLTISMLIGVVSFLPGGLGSSEVVMVLLFTTVFLLPLHSVTAAVLIARFLSLWFNIIVGSLCLGSLKLNLK